MSVCAVIVPVLNRPERVHPLIESFRASVEPEQASLYFVASETDLEEIDTIRDARVPLFVLRGPRRSGDYARKINHAARLTGEPWLFLGADDLAFRKGWLDACLRDAARYSKRVVGTNDLGNREVIARRHSTHSLVARSYIEERGTIDRPGVVLHEGYDHQWCDNEFIETAKHRSEFVSCGSAVVEHLHPHWGKAEPDETYRIALAEGRRDQILFRTRRRLWRGGSTSGPRRARVA